MVGDSYEDDIEGARALGMRAILLDRDGLFPDEADRSRISSSFPPHWGFAVRLETGGASCADTGSCAVAEAGAYPDSALTDRSIARERSGRDRQAASEEKRRLIIDAAVTVFARDGYHTSRVGDIAEEAGIAHGLLYHYFSSKEEVLATLFARTGASCSVACTSRAIRRAGRRAAARDRQDPSALLAERS